MGNTKHICYCRGGKAHCKRLSDRDKRIDALREWNTLSTNLNRYLSGDACIGEPSRQSSAEAASITSTVKEFPQAVEALASSRLKNDHIQAITALRQVGTIIGHVLTGATGILADERIQDAASADVLAGQELSPVHQERLRHVTELLTAACERSVEELAEAVNQRHSGSIIHHTALVADVLYEMLNIALFPIPQCEAATEELLPESHPHRQILELKEPGSDATHCSAEARVASNTSAEVGRQRAELLLREAAISEDHSMGDAIVKLEATARQVLNSEVDISIEPFGFTLRERAPSNHTLNATGTVTTRCTFNPWDGCIGYPDW